MQTWQDCIDMVIKRDRADECSDIGSIDSGILKDAIDECDVDSVVGSKFVGAKGNLEELRTSAYCPRQLDQKYYCDPEVSIATAIPPGSYGKRCISGVCDENCESTVMALQAVDPGKGATMDVEIRVQQDIMLLGLEMRFVWLALLAV